MTTSSASAARRRFTPTDVAAQVVPGQLALHGDRVVYTLRQIDDRGERTDLWSVSLRGGDQRRLTRSPGRDHTPRLSPDGRRLAFLRSATDGSSRVHVLDLAAGTQPMALDTLAADVLDLAWGPDGSWIAVLAEDERSDVVVRAAAGAPTALVLRRADWRADGGADTGLRLRPRHLHRLPLDGTAATRLTAGPWSAARPRVGPDGTVYFLADPGPVADVHPVPQVHCVPPSGAGAVRACTDLAGGVLRFHVAGDGLRVLGFADAPRHEDDPPRLYQVRPDASPTPLPAGDGGWLGRLGEESDLHDWQLELDDCAEVTTRSAAGTTVPIEVSTGRTWTDGPALCAAVTAHGEARAAVMSVGTGLVAPDVYALDTAGPRRLTDHGDWATAFAAPRWERREVPGPAGPITVHLLLPSDGAPPRGTVLAVHGGPNAQWGVAPPLEAVLLAGAGYRVAMPNIRGSIDRGPDWARALAGGWGDADVEDVLAVCDDLGADRLGLVGSSYGGFLVQWLIGVSDRFAAAVAENGVANQVAAWGSSDAGPSFSEAARLGSVLSADGVARLWACSPLRNVERMRTPLLMLQAADDRTCPASDNEQLFVALRALGREVEYVLYPQESHRMQGTARPDRRVDRHRRMIAWFDAHLTG